MKKPLLFLVIFFLVCGFVLSTGAKNVFAVSEQEKYGGVLKRNHSGFASQIGVPFKITGVDAAYCCYSLEPLLLPSNDTFGEWDPVLAEKWEIAPDKMSYTFHLRKNAMFHDGTPFNAEAVKWNLDHLLYGPSAFLSRVKSIEPIDDHTLRFNLLSPDPLLLCDVSDTVARLMSPAAYYTHGEKWCGTHPVGTGPWVLKDFKYKEHIKFKRNPNYWDKSAKLYIDEMHYSHILDPMTIMAELLTGNYHQHIGDIIFASQFDGKEGFSNDQFIPMHNICVYFNATDPDSIWSDIRMRHALEYAIDKEHICKTIGQGVAEPRNEIIYPFRHYGKLASPLRKYDPEKAKKLIAEAGHSKGVEVELFIINRYKTDLILAMMEQLAEVGIKIKLSQLTNAAWQAKRSVGPMPGKLWITPLMTNAPNPLFYAYNHLSPKSAYVQGLMRPSGFDDYIAQAMKKMDISEQVPILEKAEQLLYENAVMIPLWSFPFVSISSKKVHDAQWFTFGQDKANLNNAWIEK